MISLIKTINMKSGILRSILIVASGTAGAQLLTFVFIPFVARIFGPEAYGQLGSFSAVLAILSPIAALCLPIAIVLPESDGEAYSILRTSLFCGALFSAGILIILIFFSSFISSALGLEVISEYLLFIPLAMFLSVIMAVAMQWIIRKKKFEIKAKVDIYQSLLVNISKLGGGLIYGSGSVLIAIVSLAGATYGVSAFHRLSKSGDFEIKAFSPQRDDYIGIFKKYSDFWKYRAPQALLNGASQGVPVIILAKYFGSTVAGFYAIARLALGMPSMLIGSSVSDVFYPNFIEKIRSGGNGRAILLQTSKYLLLLSIIPYGLIIAFGPWLFTLVFGAEWGQAGEYARWMALWLTSFLIARPAVAAIPVLRLQRFFLLFEIVSFLAKISVMYVFIVLKHDALISIAAFSVVSVATYFFLIMVVLKKSNVGSEFSY
ncbi:lipopolysaccharide biosynthesis protein [Kerstersia gyiorum]|uniref:lipopolysaccharide biosynthesis protein n=1 Tax=Kerstersia gyiorum TaxID=206506 RepID=UPI003B4282B0